MQWLYPHALSRRLKIILKLLKLLARVVLTDHVYNCVWCRALLWDDHPALTAWKTSAPLMIIGSHQWHTPKKDGTLIRSGHLQVGIPINLCLEHSLGRRAW